MIIIINRPTGKTLVGLIAFVCTRRKRAAKRRKLELVAVIDGSAVPRSGATPVAPSASRRSPPLDSVDCLLSGYHVAGGLGVNYTRSPTGGSRDTSFVYLHLMWLILCYIAVLLYCCIQITDWRIAITFTFYYVLCFYCSMGSCLK